MKVEVKDVENSQKELTVEVPAEKYNERFEAEVKKLAPTVKIPGFRKGKAPKNIIIREHNHKLRVNALENLINDSVYEAITSEGINPLNTPVIKDVNFEENEPIKFKVYVDVFPEVNIENYKGYSFEKEIAEVRENDVEKVLEDLREKNSSFEPVEDKAVEKDDMVVIDFVGTIDGEKFEGGSANDYSIVVGSNTFLEDFEDGLIGMKPGETKNIKVTFPENYAKDLAGKEANFEVTLKEVKQKDVPELNDDFAKDIDENCETLDDLKKLVREDLEKEAAQMAKDRLYDKIIEKLIEENPFEVPETIVDEQAGRLADQTLQQYMYMYGVNPEQLGLNKDNIKDEFKARAATQVKSAIILNKLAEMHSIEVSEEEMENKIKELAEEMKKDVEEYKKEIEQQGGKESLKNNIMTDKIFDFLGEHNEIAEKYVDPDELAEKQKAEEAAEQEEPEENKEKSGEE
ncbi:trigger factor [Flexistipes sinusarabici]|uniref:trigger factor n=1 Tax=Flexistipes sinusarabici TaxID=2352 RepID=UPI0023540E01|nr:trigger factor [Flexistipes sinusarabici]